MKQNPFEKYVRKNVPSVQESQSFSITKPQFTAFESKFIHGFFKDYFEQLSISLSEIIQRKMVLELAGIEVLQFAEFIDYIPNPSLIVRFDIEDSLTVYPKCVIIIDPYIVFIFLDLLLGGKGEVLSKIREFTKLELHLFSTFFVEEFVKNYNRILNGLASQENKKLGFLKLEKVSSESALALVIPYTANVAKINFNIRIEMVDSTANFIIPFNFLREIVPQQKAVLSTTINPDILNKILKDQSKILSEKNIGFSRVELVVELGKTEVLFRDLLNIEVGDIIALDNRIDEEVKIKIEGKTKFLGKIGLVGNKIGVKITKVLSEEEAEEY
ncbi:MAG: FliM/FliN family flagellar motor switch protein [Candidatus Calescibacterium sp.]|nr:FliM/FliN family flagellar motor switch protein [Candidatus Calescibacterium sp.]MCX7972455.1 FliM/FliN family flagellar motor switch protein [bacterium]MDW8195653.1 FliM/FliN family flagellar motor switch protein [Candidatus Calescibacterium sp.]